MPADPLLGEITIFAGNFPPRGWAFCEGQLLSISQHSALFSILGTTYGGDGRSTFALPDLRGRFPCQPGHGPGLRNVRLGEKGGQETQTLSVGQMPAHNHKPTLHAETAMGAYPNPNNKMLALTPTNIYADPAPAYDKTMAPESITSDTVGRGDAFSVMNPYTAVNFIIALEGIFPSRS